MNKQTKFSKEGKEEIFNIIDDYMDLKHSLFYIRITDKRKDKAFGIMMDAGESFGGFKKEEYRISGLTKRRLDKHKIKYKILGGILQEKEAKN